MSVISADRNDTSRVEDANAMPFEQTVQLFGKGMLGVRVDQSLAIAAVRSGLPLSSAGQTANMIAMISPIVGLVLAIFFNWWWVIVGLAVSVGNFRIARSECVRSVRNRCLEDERLFKILRDDGTIKFEFKNN